MHSHVMRTMFSHAQCYNIFGPVFFQIKKALSPQWVQPHSLQQLCRKSIRRSLFRGRHGNAHPDTVAELNLPKPLESYVSYHDWTTAHHHLVSDPQPTSSGVIHGCTSSTSHIIKTIISPLQILKMNSSIIYWIFEMLFYWNFGLVTTRFKTYNKFCF